MKQMMFELLAVILTVLAASLFYAAAPSQCLFRSPLVPWKAVVGGGLCMMLAFEVMHLAMHLLTALLTVGAVLMLVFLLVPFLLAVFRPHGRLS